MVPLLQTWNITTLNGSSADFDLALPELKGEAVNRVERDPKVSTLVEESIVTITCSDNINEYGVKTMERNKENAKENETNVKGKGEEYVPIVWNRSLSLIAGANLTYV